MGAHDEYHNQAGRPHGRPVWFVLCMKGMLNMEKAFAYICTPADASHSALKRYCRKVYELGYVPICPRLGDGQYLTMDNPDEKRNFHSIARQKLCRCRMLVVCGNEISGTMSAEIGAAEKRNIICTTLEGLAKIKSADS